MNKKNIALLTGGSSSEIVISLQSAEQLSQMIDKDLFNVYIISIGPDKWEGKGVDIEGVSIDKNDFSLTTGGKKITFDCIFISIHGTPGEDGKLQGYFDMLNIPYTTSDHCSSALTFNKYICKNYLKPYNIPSSKTILLRQHEPVETEKIIQETGLPCFVKPNKGGSSFGITKVSNKEHLATALKDAFKEDNEALIEEYLEGKELTCGVAKIGKKLEIFPVTEIVSKKDFFDFEAKYTDGMAEEITPARIPEKTEHECRVMSSLIYNIFNCKGVVRIDYILKNDILYFLELNSVPGMSKNSVIPQQIRAAGLSPTDFFTRLINDCIENFTATKK